MVNNPAVTCSAVILTLSPLERTLKRGLSSWITVLLKLNLYSILSYSGVILPKNRVGWKMVFLRFFLILARALSPKSLYYPYETREGVDL